MAALPELLPRGRSPSYAVAWARSWVPALLEERGEDFIRQCWVKVANRKRRHLTTDQLSKLLKVTDDEPARLNLRCIPAASRNAKTREAERKANKAKAEAARRLRNKPNLTPRSESLAATEPWEKAGISRSKWYSLPANERAAQAVEMPVLDDFVDTVSDAPSGRIRGHQIPLHPLQEQSGHGALGRDGGALNDNTPANAASTAA
ncbi:hypothetical protein ASF56_24735 [Methylobacterium sp. Leaf122]|nr:hypothetical protein [Methylobacterium sp. Leaf122]KQQ11530.1 hypothetical protein ASF56_24735 [Methylobacterium sp. Leaf122]